MAQCIALFFSIGEIYRKQGKLNEALTMHEEVLRVRASVFGLEHLNTAKTYNKCVFTFFISLHHPEFSMKCFVQHWHGV